MSKADTYLRPVGVALAWAVVAWLSLSYARPGIGLAMVWPANAILAAALLLEKQRSRWIPIILCTAIASISVNMANRLTDPFFIPFFAVNGLIEPVLAAWLVQRIGNIDRIFDTPRLIFLFAIAMVVSCIPSALIVGFLFHISLDLVWWRLTLNWMPPHIAGMLIVTPLLLIIAGKLRGGWRQIDSSAFFQACAMLALVAAITVLVFHQTTYVISFLIVPALLIATFHLRAAGAAISVAIIAVIASIYMAHGQGPFLLMPVPVAQKAYVVQLFIATMFMCSLPLAAVLNQRDRLAAETEQHLANLDSIAQRIGEVLFRVEDDATWAYLSPSFETMTGIPAAQVIGKSALAGLPEADHPPILDAFERLRSGDITGYSFASQIVTKDGEVRHIEFDMYRCILDSGERTGAAGIFRDVTARRLIDARLRETVAQAQRAAEAHALAATTDELTRLPNRRAFYQRIEQRLAAASGVTLGVFDIDHFKRINDRYGHPAGDEVLRRITAIVASHLRPADMIARIGGEEFAVLIEAEAPGLAITIAERLITAVASEAIILPAALIDGGSDGDNDVEINVTISMGLAQSQPGQSVSELIGIADRALYTAKRSGRNQLQLAA